ncbi:MAG: nitrilase-related carbon-nitrogen hydrolase, partial [Bacteroidota bacterium]
MKKRPPRLYLYNKKMKVTVCQLTNESQQFERDWDALVQHCQHNKSELVLLPEMPFHPWIANQPTVNNLEKEAAAHAHDRWMPRLEVLGNAMVAYTRPVVDGQKFYNSAFVWTKEIGHQKVHSKYFFPEEEGFYEQTWFDREPKNFELLEINGLKVGFLLCTEIWFTQYARKYGL